MDVVFKAKSQFLDRSAVLSAVDRARLSVLTKFGAWVRRAARSSMHSAKKPSAAGKPPNVHRGQLKRLLYFTYDTVSRSVVVGPVPFAAGTAPRALERGGQSVAHKNPRRRLRTIGGAGEIRIGGRVSKTSKIAKQCLKGRPMVTYAKLHTGAQAVLANQLNEELYGPENIPSALIAPRPYMNPALAKTIPQLPPLWANSVH